VWCAGRAEREAYHPVKELPWQIAEDGGYVPYDGKATTVYFAVDASKWRGALLRISSRDNFFVFANSKLIGQGQGELLMKMDSLSKLYHEDLFFGIHQRGNIGDLKTEIVFPGSVTSDLPTLRTQDHFLDFSTISAIIILISFTILFRSTPQLTLDYFNVIKLLSVQERDDNQFPLRITASANLLFYFYCSLLSSLLLLTIFHFSRGLVSLTTMFPTHTVGQAFLQWLILTLIIFALLMGKLLLLITLAGLFGFRDTVSFQFFNFVRLLLIAVTCALFLATLYFVFHAMDQGYFYGLLKILSVLLAGGTILLYFKLMRRMPYRFFHLFSYLCVSEIVPLMILIKLFFN
jgi:hypothetical protein